ARLLGAPCATAVLKLEAGDGVVKVERELENQKVQVVELRTPAVVAVQTGINEPRYASLKGIMAAKKKEIKTVSLADLGGAAPAGGRLRTIRLGLPPKGKGAEILTGSADSVAQELVRRIREKTGVI
ncbi:MAG TPA: electron transfer flavoprotein subunit beta, partial [Candidatus Polarisedimenticolia bacterium]|nr:electron transfer flavoprotein subunit beta [Candidatus Polarisedimenticolia bacterium]